MEPGQYEDPNGLVIDIFGNVVEDYSDESWAIAEKLKEAESEKGISGN